MYIYTETNFRRNNGEGLCKPAGVKGIQGQHIYLKKQKGGEKYDIFTQLQ